MARPVRNRRICTEPQYRRFAPAAAGTEEKELSENDGDGVFLSVDEYEVIRMVDLFGCTHEMCAKHMGISRTTVTEICERARKKIADMLVNGKNLTIAGGNYSVCKGLSERCSADECPITGKIGG